MADAWSEVEIRAIVEDYFTMLQAEIKGIDYNKAAHRRKLIQQLKNRSHGSIERKHRNINAILIEGERRITVFPHLRIYTLVN